MAFTLSTMQTEVFARGFDFLNDGGAGTTRVTRWINDAMHEIDESEDWEYRFATATPSAAPVTIADLGAIESVVDTSNFNPLEPMDRRSLTDLWADLTLTGYARYWYMTSPTVLAVFPVSTAVLTVRYKKFAPDLAAGADAPLMPDRFRQIIVELACAKAFRDSNNIFAAGDCMQEVQRLTGVMLSSESIMLPPESQQLISGSLDS